MTSGILRTVFVAGSALAALSMAACAPSAQIANDVTVLDGTVSRTIGDIETFRASPTVTNGLALAADGSALQIEVAQLRTDLGSAQVPAKVALQMRNAEKLADELKSAAPAEALKMLSDATSLDTAIKAANGA